MKLFHQEGGDTRRRRKREGIVVLRLVVLVFI